jgi:hypothetical protein
MTGRMHTVARQEMPYACRFMKSAATRARRLA